MAPLNPVLKDFRVAFDQLPTDDLSQETAEKLANFFSRTNQTLDTITANTVKYSFMMFTMMPTELTSTASQLKNAIYSPLYSLLSYITMSFEPIDESCVSKLLSKFVATYEPYAYDLLKSADKTIADFSASSTNLTTLVQSSVFELRTLIKKVNSCGKLVSREFCVDQIVSKW